MEIRVSAASPLSPEEAKRWKTWAEFCERARLSPDTELPTQAVVKRFNEQTGGCTNERQVEMIRPAHFKP